MRKEKRGEGEREKAGGIRRGKTMKLENLLGTLGRGREGGGCKQNRT